MHCFPCSGSGWYITASYYDAGEARAVPFLSGPYGTQDDAKAQADAIVMAPQYLQLLTINVFEHATTVGQDAWTFFNCMANDAWDYERVDIFLELVNHPSASAVVDLLSGTWDLRQAIIAADQSDCACLAGLHAQRLGKFADAQALMTTIFDPEE